MLVVSQFKSLTRITFSSFELFLNSFRIFFQRSKSLSFSAFGAYILVSVIILLSCIKFNKRLRQSSDLCWLRILNKNFFLNEVFFKQYCDTPEIGKARKTGM